MRRILTAAIASLLISTPVFAQDAPPTGIGYIPGMPVPQRQAPAPSASSDQPAQQSNSGASGPVTRVSVAGQPGTMGQPTPVQETPPAAEAQPETIGKLDYKGVTPPTRLVPENQATFTRTADNQLSWIGFLPDETEHRVFLQTSKPTTYERLATPDDRVEILLANTKLAVSNNTRGLDMSYFQTPFSKARAVKSGTGVKIIIQLKNAAPCEIRQHDNMIDIVVKK
ncbi:MAG: hypothetical protein IJ165_11100 [Proteobacteria bacterium]|nr:hypothetical protein [Pseudomonadota bacterium]